MEDSAEGFCSGKLGFSVLTCHSSFAGSGLPCDLSSLIELGRIVGFSVCSIVYLLLGWSDSFKDLYMLNQKLEVLSHTFSVGTTQLSKL